MPNDSVREEQKKVASLILNLTSHVFNGERWGNDTVVGTDEELTKEVALILSQREQASAENAARVVLESIRESFCTDELKCRRVDAARSAAAPFLKTRGGYCTCDCHPIRNGTPVTSS